MPAAKQDLIINSQIDLQNMQMRTAHTKIHKAAGSFVWRNSSIFHPKAFNATRNGPTKIDSKISRRKSNEKTKTKWPSALSFVRISCTNYGSFEFLSAIRHVLEYTQAHSTDRVLRRPNCVFVFRYYVVVVYDCEHRFTVTIQRINNLVEDVQTILIFSDANCRCNFLA